MLLVCYLSIFSQVQYNHIQSSVDAVDFAFRLGRLRGAIRDKDVAGGPGPR